MHAISRWTDRCWRSLKQVFVRSSFTASAAPAMQTTVVDDSRSPWLSINDMLIQNKCFLCEEVFPKGKVKKVFQVSHIIDYFKDRFEQEKVAPLPPIQSRHLGRLYQRYCELLVETQPEQFVELLLKELSNDDVEVWMSGLTCDLKEVCQNELRLFLNVPLPVGGDATAMAKSIVVSSESNTTAATGGEGGAKKPKSDIMSMMTFANKDCPPGCTCDNPWPFLS
jgi:hypothetical protein